MLKSYDIKTSCWMAALASLSFACETGNVEHSSAPPATDPGVSIPFDVNEVVRNIRLGYREDGAGFKTAQDTYRVRAIDGVVAVTPKHWVNKPAWERHAIGAEPDVLEGTAMTFETVGIERGEPFELGSGAMRVAQDGSLRIDRGIAEERFVNDATVVEQMWWFEEEPAGAGELVIRVAVNGQSYGGWTTEGHHFTDEGSNVGIRYGVATWVDGTGRRTHVPVIYEDGELVLTVSEQTLATSAYPAVLDPVVSVEFGLTAPGSGPAKAREEAPSVAFDGTNFLVVWADQRNATSFDIYGARVDTSRNLVDALSFPISTAEFDQVAPSVAWNGINYFVSWSDRRSGTEFDIYGARVTPAGAVLDPNGIAVCTAAGDQTNPDSSNIGGTYWAVAWQDNRSGTENVYAARIDGAGNVPNANGVGMDVGADTQRNPAIACDGVFCLVTWVEGVFPAEEDIHSVRFRGSHGQPVDVASVSISSTATPSQRDLLPDVAFDPGTGNYYVVWQSNRSGTSYDIYGARVRSGDGSVVDQGGYIVNNRTGQDHSPQIFFHDNQFMVTWITTTFEAAGDVLAARITTTGTVTDTTGFGVNSVTGGAASPTIFGGGGRFFIAWQDSRSGLVDVYGTTVTSAALVENFTGIPLALSANRQSEAAVAYNQAAIPSQRVYFVVFTDSRTSNGDNYDLVGVRVTRTGGVLDPTGRAISLAAGNQIAPAITYDPTNNQFFVVWQDRRSGEFNIRGGRLSNTSFAMQEDILISGDAAREGFANVSYNAAADEYLVIWQDRRSGNYDIRGQRVSPAAALSGGQIDINSAAGDQTRPDISSDGTSWFVSWNDARTGTNNEDIRGALIDAAGTVSVADIAISTAANRQFYVRNEWDGTNFINVWEDERNATSDIMAARVSPAGVLNAADANGITIAGSATLDEERPGIGIVDDSTVGANTWYVVWREQVTQGGEAKNLMSRQFTVAGAAVDVAFSASAQTGDEDQPVVTGGQTDNALIIYQRFDSASTLQAERVYGRTVVFP